MKDGRTFFMAGLWLDAPDPATGEFADSYTVIITDANAVMRVHDRTPVILGTDAAWRRIEPGTLPAEVMEPYAAEAMTAWLVGDWRRLSRRRPHLGQIQLAHAVFSGSIVRSDSMVQAWGSLSVCQRRMQPPWGNGGR